MTRFSFLLVILASAWAQTPKFPLIPGGGGDTIVGEGAPGGTNGQFQYNSSGAFAGGTLAHCVSVGGVLNYNATTHAFSCHTLVAGDIPALSYQAPITGAPGSWPATFPPPAPAAATLGGVKSGQCTTTTGKLMGYDTAGDRICETDQLGGGGGSITVNGQTCTVGGAPCTVTASLPANPTACPGGQFTSDIAADGTLTCATPAGGGSVFAGSTADTVTSSATPAFSFADQTGKSPIVRKFTPTVNVTAPTFTNLSAGARMLLYITTTGSNTWNWNSTIADNICNVWTQSAGTTVAEIFVDPNGTTLHGGLCVGGPAGLLALSSEGSTCASSPAAGTLCVWADSSDHTVKARDSSGNVGVLARSTASRTANQFVTHIPSTGIPATAGIVDADLPAAITRTIASGATALATASIAANSCATVVTATATGVVSTDVVQITPNASIKTVTGYTPAGTLTITQYPGAGNVNFDVCNKDQTNAVTPGAVTLNWKVFR